MNEKEIVKFLLSNIKPVSDEYGKKVYRAAAYLKDRTYLPCVVFRRTSDMVNLAMCRFNEAAKKKEYKTIVQSFVTSGNRVDIHSIAKAEESPFSLPTKFYNAINSGGETSMGWVAFSLKMDDNNEFYFGTPFDVKFFEMPDGYTTSRIKEVSLHKSSNDRYFKDKPFFTCYLDSLE